MAALERERERKGRKRQILTPTSRSQGFPSPTPVTAEREGGKKGRMEERSIYILLSDECALLDFAYSCSLQES